VGVWKDEVGGEDETDVMLWARLVFGELERWSERVGVSAEQRREVQCRSWFPECGQDTVNWL